jgi:two-component system, OmpR family, response regulator
VAARSKSRKKAKAAKRSRPGRADAKLVETPPALSPPEILVDIIEVPPEPTPQPVSAELIMPALEHPAQLRVDVYEMPPESLRQATESNLTDHTEPEPPEPDHTEPDRTEPEPAEPDPPEPEPPPAPIEEAPSGPIKILLVEDGNFLRLEIQRALVRAGYAVVQAADGEAAIDAARKTQPDLILLDLLLPKIAGQDVLKALKRDPATADISVVVLTGLSQKNAERLQADGALAFLEKSDLALDKGPDVLLAALSSIVQRLPRTRGRKRAAAASRC